MWPVDGINGTYQRYKKNRCQYCRAQVKYRFCRTFFELDNGMYGKACQDQMTVKKVKWQAEQEQH
jgi:hypothetical protein